MTDHEVMKVILDNWQESLRELRSGIIRIHERLDQIIEKDYVPRVDCEGYRKNCTKGGYPVWVVVLFSITSSLVVFMLTYAITR